MKARGYRWDHLWWKYRLRQADFLALLKTQKGRCGICKSAFQSQPHVDHCHETHQVRGLLCRTCNALLAAVDRRGFLDQALKYLAMTDRRKKVLVA